MVTENDSLRSLYPHLRFSKQWDLGGDLQYALGQCDGIVEAISEAPILRDFHNRLLLLSLRKGAQATTAIEGNALSEEEIEKLTPGEPAAGIQEYEQREVQNILDTFNSILQQVVRDGRAEAISPEVLLRLHAMIGKDLDARFTAIPGQFAQSQRIVGSVYRAPRPEHVPALVRSLCEWLMKEFHYPEQRFADAVVEAIVAHVYIEWIHPFDDGNGRVGRTMEYYILARGGLPAIASHLLANHYNETRPEYYRQLQRARVDNSLTGFIEYALSGLSEGLKSTLRTVQENAWTQMWRVAVHDAFEQQGGRRGPAVKRQRQLALTMPLDSPVALADLPKLTTEMQREYEALGMRTLFRDLRQLAKLGLITREPGVVRARRSSIEDARPDRRRARRNPIETLLSSP